MCHSERFLCCVSSVTAALSLHQCGKDLCSGDNFREELGWFIDYIQNNPCVFCFLKIINAENEVCAVMVK